MEEWKEYQIADICKIKHGFAFKGQYFTDCKQPYVCITPGNFAIKGGFKLNKPKYYNGPIPENYILHANDLIITMTDLSKEGDTLGYSALVPQSSDYIFLHNQRIGLVEEINDKIDKHFLYWIMRTYDYQKYIVKHCSGSTVKHTSPNNIGSYFFKAPSLKKQKDIASILDNFEAKIELNRRINANLEAQAQALFRSWFVDNDNQLDNYQTKSLTDIAQYLNGLAMQKFPPESIQNSLPVLKIKELGQGLCDASSDRCSTSIKPEYIINDGDVIFSWSGTLLVDVWCGGKCGLNQHLFKVTSDNYPKWFIFYWTKHHLDKFIRIAKDKAVTMGHIKRCDLESSEVKVPEKSILEYLDKIFTPLFDSMITHRIENRKLSALRDTLLPKLMAGELNLE